MTSPLPMPLRGLLLIVCLGTLGACTKSNARHGESAAAESAGGELAAAQPACVHDKKKLHDPNERLGCLLDVAGAGHVFLNSDMRTTIRHEIMPKLELFAPDVRAKIDSVIETSFDGAKLEQRFRQLFMERYNAQHVDELLDFYGSPIGARLAAQRDEDPSPEQMKDWFEKHEPTEKRIDEVADILQASHALESVAVMVRLPIEGLVSVLTPLESGTPVPTDEQISAMLSPAIESAQTAVAAHTLYSMRVFNDKELAKLAAFEKGSAAQWYHEGLLVAVTTALGEAFGSLSDAVRKAAGQSG